MRIHILAAAALALGTSAAWAQDQDEEAAETQAVQATQQQEEDDRGSEVLCRTERVTGSLTRRTRTCLTRDEWAAVEARTRDEMNRMGRNASGGKSCNQDQFGGC